MSLLHFIGNILMLGVNIVFVAIPTFIVYVIYSLAIYKLLRRTDYVNSWMAWIPYLNYYALADCVCYSNYVTILGQSVNAKLFKFWFVVSLLISAIPYVGGVLSFILQTLCLGYCFTEIFAIVENRMTVETKLIGHLAGAFPIIGVIKSFLIA